MFFYTSQLKPRTKQSMALIQFSVGKRGSGGQNDKNLNKFSVTKDILFVPGRWLLWDEKILVTKFHLYRKSINRI